MAVIRGENLKLEHISPDGEKEVIEVAGGTYHTFGSRMDVDAIGINEARFSFAIVFDDRAYAQLERLRRILAGMEIVFRWPAWVAPFVLGMALCLLTLLLSI